MSMNKNICKMISNNLKNILPTDYSSKKIEINKSKNKNLNFSEVS
jgi:hypothetical protein